MLLPGFLSLLCFWLLLLPSASAQQPAARHDTVYFTSGRRSIRLPFKLVHNLIVIPVKINNSNSLNFILDTGVRSTLITRLYYSDSLELNQTNRTQIRGLGSGYTIEAIISKGNSLRLPHIKGENQEIYVLMEDVFNLSTRMGMPIHGIIGYDIFKNFIVKVNYSSKTLTLYRPDVRLKKKRKAEEYPLHIENDKAYIYANVRQHNGDTLQVKLVVDTGASHTLSLYLPTDERLELPPKTMEAFLGRGLSGDINGKIGRLAGFSMGRYELQNLPASYPDEESIRAALNIANRNGNLGSDILKRFTVVFDYPHKRLLLLPNNKYKEPFHFNMSGFEVSTPLPGVNFYEVTNVVPNSPATAAGVQNGDELISINGKSCFDLNLNDVLDTLESKPGRKLRLRLRRNGEEIDVNLVLESRI
ncbi:aspartyl protease family protein [Pontibacter sp. 172403-2]|uniref:aspartyl protease family protein n=1 Tax=Pontibacter rufus TaxID=2791028 RepID=UPI0018AFEAF0|nr:aspartyl protease family protein [Pontibacter sp. 172403-2]MBF9253611.1 aspartyl protease family protein [Pontibacter sp. 172403-2]